MKEIGYLNYPTDGTYCRYSTEEYKPLYFFKSYETQARITRKSKPSGYHTGRDNDSYDFSLYFQGRSMNAVLENLLRDKGRINLLDIGCGEGRGLMLPRSLTRRVNRFGISASELRNPIQKIANLAEGVRITIGNAERLTDYYPRNFFDVAVSLQAMCHMDQLKVMPQIVEVLIPNGIAMLEHGSDILASRIPRVTDLESYEKGVSFRKTPGL